MLGVVGFRIWKLDVFLFSQVLESRIGKFSTFIGEYFGRVVIKTLILCFKNVDDGFRRFDQIQGVDFDKTWAPTGKLGSLLLALIYGLKNKMSFTQFNVKGAFLHAPLNKNVIIRTPEGSTRKFPYLKLNKSLYGL